MADGVASDSDGSDIAGVDEFIRDDFDGEIADNPLDRAQQDQVSFKAHFWNDTRIVQFWYTRTAQF